MKKSFFLIVVFFTTVLASAQDTDDKITWYYSLGAVVNPDFNINDNLMASGGHRIADVSSSVSVGWNVVTKDRIAIGVEFGVATTLYGRKNSGYNLVQAPISLSAHYIAVDKEKFAFSLGLHGSYVFYDLSLYKESSVIDMNNLDPSENTGYIRLNNQSAYVGPSVAFTFLRHKSYPLTVSMGYDFAVTNSKWEADYATLGNPVKENGGRGYIQLNIPFGTIGGIWAGSTE